MTAPRQRWLPLAALALAVLAAHLLVLQAVPGALTLAPAAATTVVQLRTIRPEPAAQAPKEAVVPVARAPIAPEKIAIRPKSAATSPAAASEPAPAPGVSVAPMAPTEPPTLASEPVAAAFAIPGSARWRYDVQAQYRGFSVPGRAELVWRQDGSHYEAQLEISSAMLPSRVQRSAGRITAEGLAPLRFSDRSRSEEAAHFDRDAGKVIFSTNRPEAALLPGAQDRLSVLLQLGALVAAQPARFSAGTVVSLQTAGTREAEVWQFTVEGEEELALAGGPVRGLKLTRSPRKEFDQKVEVWLGPGMDYGPVRLRLTQPNGDWLDLQWSATDKG